MKKFIKMTLIVFLILFLLAAGTAVFFIKTFDLNNYRSQIENKLSAALNREVSLEKIYFRFSFAKGAYLLVSNITVLDDLQFSSGPFIDVKSVHLSLNIAEFIRKRSVVLTDVEIVSPKVFLRKGKESRLNVETLKPADRRSPDSVSFGKSAEDNKANKPLQSQDAQIEIESLKIVDADINYEDYSVDPPIVIGVSDIDFEIKNFAFNKPFSTRLSFSLLSRVQNFQIRSAGRVDAAGQKLFIDEMGFTLDFSEFKDDEIRKFVQTYFSLGLTAPLKGILTVSLKNFVFSPTQPVSFSSNINYQHGELSVLQIPYALTDVSFNISATQSDINLTDFVFSVASGHAEIKTKLGDYISSKNIIADVELKGLKLSELLKDQNFPVTVLGDLYGQFHIEGPLGSKTDSLNLLTGTGSINVQNGKIADVNLIRLVLDKISMIPNLVEEVEKNLPEKYKEKLTRNETILNKVTVDVFLKDGALFLKPIHINADDFQLLSDAVVDMKANIDFSGNIFFPKDLSQKLVEQEEALSGLYNENEELFIPLKPYQGLLAEFRLSPDLGYVSKRVIKTKGKEELKKVIFKALEIEESGPQTDPSGQAVDPSTSEPPPPEAVIIENILDSIFK